MIPPTCPHCGSNKHQTKAGYTKFKSPRIRCVACDKDYTPLPKQQGYSKETKLQAVKLHLEGLSFRAIARILNVNPQSVANWVQDQQQTLEQSGKSCLPDQALDARIVELDEVHVFVGAKRGEKNASST